MLDGCDISFIAEAPNDITLEQLLNQTNKIKPDWCACGIRSLDESEQNIPVEIVIGYTDIRKANEYVPCQIIRKANEYVPRQIKGEHVEVVRCKDCYAYQKETDYAIELGLNPREYCALLRCEMPEYGFCYYGNLNMK